MDSENMIRGPTGCSRRENFTMLETAIRGPRVPGYKSVAVVMPKKHCHSKGRARPVPAAAVTPAARVVTVIIGSKGSVAGRISLLGNLALTVRLSGDTVWLEAGRGERYFRGRGEIL